MNETCYQTSVSAVYREVGDELVVIQVDTGSFYYFNRTTKQFLDFFRNPAKLGDFVEAAHLKDGSEQGYLEAFLAELREKRILESSQAMGKPAGQLPGEYSRPTLLREGEKKLDEIASEIAVLTSGFL